MVLVTINSEYRRSDLFFRTHIHPLTSHTHSLNKSRNVAKRVLINNQQSSLLLDFIRRAPGIKPSLSLKNYPFIQDKESASGFFLFISDDLGLEFSCFEYKGSFNGSFIFNTAD
jgi:hypothetical protein